MIELDRKIGHNSVMSIREFFVDTDEPSHLVDQFIRDMGGIGQSLCSDTGIILFPYEYSPKYSAHSQHCQTPKACDIDNIVNKNMYYCTYFYALIQSNQKINTGKASPPSISSFFVPQK